MGALWDGSGERKTEETTARGRTKTHFLRIVSVVRRISEKSPIVFYGYLMAKEYDLEAGSQSRGLMRNGSGLVSSWPCAVGP
jgi:hypothetical protein